MHSLPLWHVSLWSQDALAHLCHRVDPKKVMHKTFYLCPGHLVAIPISNIGGKFDSYLARTRACHVSPNADKLGPDEAVSLPILLAAVADRFTKA